MSKNIADILFAYLKDIIYNPVNAHLNADELPDDFKDLGKGLQYFCNCLVEASALAKELAKGNLDCPMPSRGNELASPLKMLHSSLKHLTWQTQQVAKGDYKQRVDFMGDFSAAFNNMVSQLAERWEISLNEKEQLQTYMNLMLANSADPILIFDKELRLAYASVSYLQYRGLSNAGGIAGMHFSEFFSGLVSAEFIKRINEIFDPSYKSKSSIETALDINFSQSGNVRHYRMRVSPMLRGSGRPEGIMVILYDTTEIVSARHEAEQALDIAERSSRAKTDFLARISHEMRTPMNAIRGMTEIYGKTSDINRKDYCVEKIDEASRDMIEVINSILDMSQFESGTLRLSEKECSLKKIVDRASDKIKPHLGARSQKLSVDIGANVPKTIVTDETRLAQVLVNLLSNALKHSGDGGEIFLFVQAVTENQCRALQFTVKDNGTGISEEDQERLFIPFEQLDGASTRKVGGMGLGLAVSKRLINLMGGDIRVESKLGKGSSFIFKIPCEVNEKTAKKQMPGAESQSNDGIFKGRKILIVEDIEINREIVISLLEHTGIETDIAENGAEAVEKFTRAPNAYDLILMDINMPVMDGYQATARIRNSGFVNSLTIPIVAMTSNTFSEDIEKCLAAGINSHLAKPIDLALVIACLKEYLL